MHHETFSITETECRRCAHPACDGTDCDPNAQGASASAGGAIYSFPRHAARPRTPQTFNPSTEV